MRQGASKAASLAQGGVDLGVFAEAAFEAVGASDILRHPQYICEIAGITWNFFCSSRIFERIIERGTRDGNTPDIESP